MRKSLLVICHSRPKLLANCLQSCFEARGFSEFALVVVQQTGSQEVTEVISQNRRHISLLVETDGYGPPEANIARNRYLGYFACYQTLQADIVLALEDDVQISTDALEFVSEVYSRYENVPDFMGINLGSVEPFNMALLNSYSFLRYGIHGQASVLNRKVWSKLLKSSIVQGSSPGHFDSALEPILRCGFMVTPNNSRHIDNGHGGTHAPHRVEDDYFARIEASWVGDKVKVPLHYFYQQIPHHWRSDAVPYKRWQNFYYRFIEPRRRQLGTARRSIRQRKWA